MDKLVFANAPHLHSHNSTSKIMLDVIIALLPATVASVVLFGVKALLINVVCVVTAVLSEYVYNLVSKKPQTVTDLSAAVTGLILGLNLSANVELWQAALGSAFAIVVVKCFFGGLGKNFANPAITGRIFMFIAFASVAGGAMPVVAEFTSSATPLQLLKTGAELPTLTQMLLGVHGGAIGETCIIALVLGFIYLVAKKVIKWLPTVAFILTVFCLYFVTTFDFTYSLYQMLSGGLFLGAIFMATDYVTTPITDKGKLVFCIGCGVITFIIRYFCAYPEGVSFSILIMNLLVPYIEKVTHNNPIGGVK